MVRVAVTSICFCLLAAGSGCGRSDLASVEKRERESSLYRKACEAERTGNLKEAIRLYNRVLVEEPKSFSAHFQLATLLQDHMEDYIGAIYHYQQYLYLRPESEKSELAKERVRIAEQLLAPQILRKVGDSAQGISQAHLLKENDRLNRLNTKLEGEKAVLSEQRDKAEQALAALQAENERLRTILSKMRVSEAVPPGEPLRERVEAAVRTSDGGRPAGRPDSQRCGRCVTRPRRSRREATSGRASRRLRRRRPKM